MELAKLIMKMSLKVAKFKFPAVFTAKNFQFFDQVETIPSISIAFPILDSDFIPRHDKITEENL